MVHFPLVILNHCIAKLDFAVGTFLLIDRKSKGKEKILQILLFCKNVKQRIIKFIAWGNPVNQIITQGAVNPESTSFGEDYKF